MNGIKGLRTDEEGSSCPTTESNPDKMELAKEAGLAAWIKKPGGAENFFDQIQRTLSGRAVPG